MCEHILNVPQMALAFHSFSQPTFCADKIAPSVRRSLLSLGGRLVRFTMIPIETLTRFDKLEKELPVDTAMGSCSRG